MKDYLLKFIAFAGILEIFSTMTPLAVKLLLEEGADPTLVNHGQATALSLALSKDHQQSAFYIRAFIESWYIQNPIKKE